MLDSNSNPELSTAKANAADLMPIPPSPTIPRAIPPVALSLQPSLRRLIDCVYNPHVPFHRNHLSKNWNTFFNVSNNPRVAEALAQQLSIHNAERCGLTKDMFRYLNAYATGMQKPEGTFDNPTSPDKPRCDVVDNAFPHKGVVLRCQGHSEYVPTDPVFDLCSCHYADIRHGLTEEEKELDEKGVYLPLCALYAHSHFGETCVCRSKWHRKDCWRRMLMELREGKGHDSSTCGDCKSSFDGAREELTKQRRRGLCPRCNRGVSIKYGTIVEEGYVNE